MWATADQSCLQYIGLEDAIHAVDDNLELNDLGQHVRFQDSMAIVQYYRTIDLFFTVTNNPDWPEVVHELFPGQHPSDCPDLIAWAFQLKKEGIIRDIKKNSIFRCAVVYIYAIEFHKRGLPHMHLLIFLEQGWKLLAPEDIYSAIWA
ncbi:Helitron helicase-like domain at N-terminus-domain-containing protein [Mycena albidolilacea]|uniref:Helitron helicase-like domain at N-terminus-domain-containing protein n=1 Tax=Mycena albidolilacea TaxID=1033008 RepID=A0AAD7ASF2_9AGAR|nr:Helitron helicase-like domain at N-terminus-domain-containing protein [Mycena albidolilacea]